MGLNPDYLLKSFLLYWIPSSHKVYSILMCQLLEIKYGSHVTHFYHMALQILKLRNTQPSKWHPLIYLGIYSTLGCYLTMHVLGKIDSLTSFAQALYNISQRCQRLRLPRHIIYRVAKIGVHEVKSIKVEKILKGSLDSIPSPSVKIQIMGREVCLRCEGKTLLVLVKKRLETKSLLTSPSNVSSYFLK